jgi:hypothetical protein
MLDSLKHRIRRPSAGLVVGSIALVAALVGGAYAAIPGDNGQISACYATKNGLLLGIPHSKGDLRAVDFGEACRPYEKALSWAQQGPKGDPGISGYERVTAEGKGFAFARCPAGKKVLGGGFHASPGTSPYAAGLAVDADGNQGYDVGTSNFNNTVTAEAFCAHVAP